MLRRTFPSLVALQSEKPLNHFSEKVVRGTAPKAYWPHPVYVMSREKMLAFIWRDNAIFSKSLLVLAPVLAIGYVSQEMSNIRKRPTSAGSGGSAQPAGGAGGFSLNGAGFGGGGGAISGGASSTQFCISPSLFDVCGLLFDPPSGITVQAILHLPAHSALRSHITAFEWLNAATTTLGLRPEAGTRVFEAFYCLSQKRETRCENTRHTLAAIAPGPRQQQGAAQQQQLAAYQQYALKRVVSMPGLMIFLMAQVFLEKPPRYAAGEQHHDQFVAFVKQHIAEIVASVSVSRPGKVQVGELQELRLLFREFNNGMEVPFGTSMTSDLFSTAGSAQSDGSVEASTVTHYIRGRLFSASEVRGAVAITTMTHRNMTGQTMFIQHTPSLKSHCSLKLQRNAQSTFYVLAPCPNTVLTSLTNCVVVLGPVAGLLVIDRCEQCHVMATTAAVVLSNCRNVVLNVCTNLPTVLVGANDACVIGPYNSYYPALEEHLNVAGVNPELNLFDVGLPAGTRQEPATYVPYAVPASAASSGTSSSTTTRTNPTVVPQEYIDAVQHRKATINEITGLLRDTYRQLESAGRKDLAAGLRSRVHQSFSQWLSTTGQVQGLLDLLHSSGAVGSAGGAATGAGNASGGGQISAQPPSTAPVSTNAARPNSSGGRR